MSVRFSREALEQGNGLECIFCKSDPDRYRDQQRCRPGRGWLKVGDLSEHIWRGHAPATHCAYCGTRWPSLDRAKKLLEAREKHIPGCRMKHGDKKRQIQYREPNIISEEQQDELKKVKEIKDIERKLETLYTACGLPLPETYHVKPLGPQIVRGQFCEPEPFLRPNGTNSGSHLLDGFQNPTSDLNVAPEMLLSLRYDSLSVLSNLAEADSSYASPANQPDSGYGGSQTQDTKRVPEECNNLATPSDFLQGEEVFGHAGGAYCISEPRVGEMEIWDQDHGEFFRDCLQI